LDSSDVVSITGAPLAPQTRGPRAARKLAQIVAAKSSPACLRPHAISPTASQRLSRKRRTEDGIVVSCSTVTPDCQELDWHDTRADTRPRDPPRVHPALQCLPTRTLAPSIAARRPAAQPRSAPLTGRDGQAGPARCPSCAWCPAPRQRPRSVCHVVVVGLVPRPVVWEQRFYFKSWRCRFKRSLATRSRAGPAAGSTSFAIKAECCGARIAAMDEPFQDE